MKPQHFALAVGVSAIGGFQFVVLKVGLGEFPPVLFAVARFVLVIAILSPLPEEGAGAHGRDRRHRGVLRGAALPADVPGREALRRHLVGGHRGPALRPVLGDDRRPLPARTGRAAAAGRARPGVRRRGRHRLRAQRVRTPDGVLLRRRGSAEHRPGDRADRPHPGDSHPHPPGLDGIDVGGAAAAAVGGLRGQPRRGAGRGGLAAVGDGGLRGDRRHHSQPRRLVLPAAYLPGQRGCRRCC